jgi:hypothetical protein
MTTYNFKKFFESKNPIHNEEWVTNGHFMIKKSVLRKSQLNFINPFNHNEQTINQFINGVLKNEMVKDIIAEFIPKYYNGYRHIIITDINSKEIAIREEYYNFINNVQCKLLLVTDNPLSPIHIYKNDEFVGIVLPYKIDNGIEKNDYNEYIKQLQEQEQQKKQARENSKKCLYISNNKAVVRNKELTCITELTGDNTFENLYVESDYKKDGGKVFIDFGFIFMHVTSLGKYDVEPDTIKYRLEEAREYTFAVYKDYINICLNNNQFINVAEIKLMELAGESKEYIKTLTDHRQKVMDLREQKRNARELKREQEEQEYVTKKNNEVEDLVKQAEQAIINKGKITNKNITIYKSKYDSNSLSLINHMMKLYDIKVPLKTQGWINQALANIHYDNEYNEYTYQYYSSSKNSTVFDKYLKELANKVNEKYRNVA